MDFRKILHRFRHCRAELILIFFWIAGLLFGAFSAQRTDRQMLSLLLHLPSSPLSAAGAMVSILIPFAAVVSCTGSYAISLIAGLRAFAFAYTAVSLNVVYGSAGWLLQLLLQFGAIISLPLFFWFVLRRLTGRAIPVWDILIVCVFTVAISAAQFYLVAPLLGRITF